MRKPFFRLLLMALPFMILIIVFNYIPLMGWIYAFFDYKPGLKLYQSHFVGMKYFLLALSGGSELLTVLRNTLVLSFLNILTSPLPVIFAILLSETPRRRFRKFVQTVTTLPNFISWVLVFMLSFTFFSVDDGFVNNILLKLKIVEIPINFLAIEGLVWPFQTAINVWKTLGWSAIIYLAAITSIDQELYDAAKVDGTGRFRSILHITIPGIMPTFTVILLLQVGNMLTNGFDQYFVFYNPMVHNSIQVLDLYLYRMGIVLYDYSYSTALGMFKTIVSVILLFFVNFVSKKVRGDSII